MHGPEDVRDRREPRRARAPDVELRRWVLTLPFGWRRRLAFDGELLGALTRIYMRCNPHLHVLFLDGTYEE